MWGLDPMLLGGESVAAEISLQLLGHCTWVEGPTLSVYTPFLPVSVWLLL